VHHTAKNQNEEGSSADANQLHAIEQLFANVIQPIHFCPVYMQGPHWCE
jgi:hypothetical protein